ncbi:hypothetical protein [Mucilaginibacter rubeus]|nr:hypothetical protein [Mucilaginibacter rubeus]
MGIEQNESGMPEWQVDIIRERVESYNNDPKQILDFNDAMDDIENNL